MINILYTDSTIRKVFGPTWNGINLQDSGSFFMDYIVLFHEILLCLMLFIIIFVTWLLIKVFFLFNENKLIYLNNNKNCFYYFWNFSKIIYNKTINKVLNFIIKFLFSFYFFYDFLIMKVTEYELLINIHKKLYFKTSNAGRNLFHSYYLVKKVQINKFKRNFKFIFEKDFSKSYFRKTDFRFVTLIYFERCLQDSNLNMVINYLFGTECLLKKDQLKYNYNFNSDITLEIIWTLIPAFILLLVAIPSLWLLNQLKIFGVPILTINVTGHQWWWEYEYSDFLEYSSLKVKTTLDILNLGDINQKILNSLFVHLKIQKYYDKFINEQFVVVVKDNSFVKRNMFLKLIYEFKLKKHFFFYDKLNSVKLNTFINESILELMISDKKLLDIEYNLELKNEEDICIIESYMILDEDLKLGQFRLLDVDNRLILPANKLIRILVTSDDVLHSWAIPSLGIKIDACPGRVNEIFLKTKYAGVFYGQCSELCGYYHGFMPIVIEAVDYDTFIEWCSRKFLNYKFKNFKIKE